MLLMMVSEGRGGLQDRTVSWGRPRVCVILLLLLALEDSEPTPLLCNRTLSSYGHRLTESAEHEGGPYVFLFDSAVLRGTRLLQDFLPLPVFNQLLVHFPRRQVLQQTRGHC